MYYKTGVYYRNFWGYNPNKHYAEIWIVAVNENNPNNFINEKINTILSLQNITIETIIGGREQKTPEKIIKIVVVISSQTTEHLSIPNSIDLSCSIDNLEEIADSISKSGIYRIGPFADTHSHRLFAFPFFNQDMLDVDYNDGSGVNLNNPNPNPPDRWAAVLTGGQYASIVKSLYSEYGVKGFEILIEAFKQYAYPTQTPIKVSNELNIPINAIENLANLPINDTEEISLYIKKFFDILKSNNYCWLSDLKFNSEAVTWFRELSYQSDLQDDTVIETLAMCDGLLNCKPNAEYIIIVLKFESTTYRAQNTGDVRGSYPLIIMGYVKGLMQYMGIPNPEVAVTGIENKTINTNEPSNDDPFFIIGCGKK